jgi:tRNA pseudouridine55 synthase
LTAVANLVQLRMLEDLDGFLLVDKPAGIAYSTVVKTVKRKFNLVKVGHGGSLDTSASGLLVLLVNDANKFVGDVMGADRVHSAVMRLGLRTDTHDMHGRRLGECGEAAMPSREEFDRALGGFKGDIFQTEPRFCSVRREGAAQYEVADTGEHSQFMSHVYRFGISEFAPPKVAFEVFGTKALLVRTLVNDIGDALGCGACLESLRRTRIGKFSVEEAIPFERLLATETGDFASCVMPLSVALR